MGGALVALWLAAALSAEPAPITGAFGISFAHTVDRGALSPLPTTTHVPPLLAGFEPVEPPAHLKPAWFELTPLLPLEVLGETRPEYLVQTNETGLPLRIRVEARPSGGCSRLQHELAGLLAVKYAASSAAPWIEGSAEYGDGDRRATLSCEQADAVPEYVVLEYVDRAAYAAWYDRWKIAIAAWRNDDAQRADLALADRVTLGPADALEGAFGIDLKSVYPGVPFALADIPLPVPAAGDVDLPVSQMSIVLDPQRVPYEVKAEIVYPDERSALARFDDLRRAFREKYGAPARDQSNHLIFNIGGDLLTARIKDGTHIGFTAVRQSGLQDQRVRKREALARSDAERKIGWDSTLRGL